MSAKRFRDDTNSKVAQARSRAGMAFVQMAFILHRELRRGETAFEALAQTLHAAHRLRRGFARQPEYLRQHEDQALQRESQNVWKFIHRLTAKFLAT